MLSSKVSHSNYTLVKTSDRLWSSDKCAFFLLVGWCVEIFWYLFFICPHLFFQKMKWNCLGWCPTVLCVRTVSTTSHNSITLSQSWVLILEQYLTIIRETRWNIWLLMQNRGPTLHYETHPTTADLASKDMLFQPRLWLQRPWFATECCLWMG